MKHHYLQFSLFILYIIVMTAVLIWQGVGITPDRYSFVLLLGSLLIKRTRQFLLDWVPFMFILVSYDFLRSLADKINPRVEYFTMINFDQGIFGTLPTQYLQGLLYQAGTIHWYDYIATILYLLHFALPLSVAFFLWLYNRHYFRQFVLAIVLLSYAGWATYIVFPAAPPWMASDKGYVSHIDKITNITFNYFPDKLHLPTIYEKFDPNPIAAVPSMHAAYPFLVLIFFIKFFKWKGLYFLPYVLAISFSIIYLGEHYVFDVVLGIVYALVFYYLTGFLFRHKYTLMRAGQNSFKYTLNFIQARD